MQIAIATLREEEAETALPTLPFAGGSEALRVALAIAIVVGVGIGFIIARIISAPGRLNERVMVAFALSVSPAIFLACVYFGVLSAVQLFPALALYFFARREKFKSALALYLTNAVAQGTFAGLIIAGVI